MGEGTTEAREREQVTSRAAEDALGADSSSSLRNLIAVVDRVFLKVLINYDGHSWSATTFDGFGTV